MTSFAITVNGKSETVGAGGAFAVTDLLERHGLSGQPVAVEVNKALVPKREHAGTALKDGDVVELVTLVGGG